MGLVDKSHCYCFILRHDVHDMKLESIYASKYQNLSAKGFDWTRWAT